MYEAARVAGDGPTTTARFAATVADAGFDGVVALARHDDRPEDDLAAIRDAYDVDVVEGVEVVTDDKAVASGTIGNLRPKTTVLAVRGGSPEMNRYVAENAAVDVLRAPMAGEGDVDHVVVRRAAENGVRLEVDLGPVLRREGGPRVQALRGIRKLRDLVDDLDAPYVVSASPSSHLSVRAPRELRAVGEAVGLGDEWVDRGLAEWSTIAETNREKRSDRYVAEGVWIDGEGDDA
ncbi:MAG: RNase P subunit p30 family protein [Halanaeroarchaeum sp.]